MIIFIFLSIYKIITYDFDNKIKIIIIILFFILCYEVVEVLTMG